MRRYLILVVLLFPLFDNLRAAEPQHFLAEIKSEKDFGSVNQNFRNVANEIRILSGSPTFSGTATAAKFANICPSGFTAILGGCIQNAEQGSAIWETAHDDCFDTYGGKLPSSNELSLAFNKLSLTDEDDDFEMTDDLGESDVAILIVIGIKGDADPAVTGGIGAPRPYRCWIPIGGGL